MTTSVFNITSTLDDGVEQFGGWDDDGGAGGDSAGHVSIGRWGGGTSYTGLRFSTNLPATLPISNATLSVYSPGGIEAQTNAPTLIFHGDDVDNSAALASQRPSLRTPTSASLSFPIASQQFETAGWHDFNVTSIVQEILNRTGFSDHITLIGYNPDGNQGGTSKVLFEDYSKVGGHPAKLSVTYSSDPIILSGPSSVQNSEMTATFTGLHLEDVTSVDFIHGAFSVSETQEIISQSTNSITIDFFSGDVPFGQRFFRFYKNSTYVDFQCEFKSGSVNYGDVVIVDPLVDVTSCLYELDPPAIAGCVVEYANVYNAQSNPSGHWTVIDNGRMIRKAGSSLTNFSYRVWHPTPEMWSVFGTITITDAPISASRTETLFFLGDTSTSNVVASNNQVVESVTLNDSIAVIAAFESAASEAIATNDLSTIGTLIPSALEESISLAEATIKSIEMIAQREDSASPADSMIGSIIATRIHSESVSVTESNDSLKTLNSVKEEVATLSDIVSSGDAIVGAASESISMSESSSIIAVLSSTATEQAALTNTQTSIGFIGVSLTESIVIADTSNFGGSNMPVPIPYITRAQLVIFFGEKEIAGLADRDNDGQDDESVLTMAISTADRLIDGYIGGRYAVPLEFVPQIIIAMASDITRYYLYDDSAPEQVKERYAERIKQLKHISDGTMDLPIDIDKNVTPDGIGVDYYDEPNLFTLDSLADF